MQSQLAKVTYEGGNSSLRGTGLHPTGNWPPSLRGTGLHPSLGLASIPTGDWSPSLRGTGLQRQLTEVRYGAGTCPRYPGQADLHLQGELASVPKEDWPPSLGRTGLRPYGGLASVPTGDWPPSLRGTGLRPYGGLASRASWQRSGMERVRWRTERRGTGRGVDEAAATRLLLRHLPCNTEPEF
jgi:hypothetical protein